MDISRLKFNLIAKEAIQLPSFHGSTFRGAFGNVLKNLVCIRKDRECTKCMIKTSCTYSFIFESAVYFQDTKPTPAGGIPKPFVLEPPLGKDSYSAGDCIDLGLVLIGHGIDYLPYFLAVIERMGQVGIGRDRGRYVVNTITDTYSNEILYEHKEGDIDGQLVRHNLDFFRQKAKQWVKPESCRIYLITPLRVKTGGKYTDSLTFETFIRVLLRRITYLEDYFWNERTEFDYRAMIDATCNIKITSSQLQWNDWERFSRRQGMMMKLGGLIGELDLQGNLEPFLPILLMGQELHIGKNTTFGLGQYKLKTVVDLQ